MGLFVLISFIILIFLFAVSAFWSLAETGMTSLSKYRIKKIIALNKSMSDELKQWLRSPYYILTTILVGDTLTSLIISSLATVMVFAMFTGISRGALEFSTWLLLTFFSLVFCEITPKIIARFNPEKVTLLSLPILSRLVKITRPLAWPVIRLIKFLFPSTNLLPISRLTYLSLEEIKGLISEANTSGMLGKEASLMLQGALRLGGMEVRQIMTPIEKIEAVNLELEPEVFLDMLVETGRSRVPVYSGSPGKIAGFVHTKDLLFAWRRNKGRISKEIVRPAYFVPPEKKIYELLKEFQSGRTHMAFVSDALGSLVGLVTLEDLLEEILGEILDEYDIKKQKS